MNIYTLKRENLNIEVIPCLNNPWGTAYYGSGKNDNVTVEGFRREHYRNVEREDMMVADLLMEIYALLSPLVDYETIRPMVHLQNYSIASVGEADLEWIMDQEMARVMEDVEDLYQLCIQVNAERAASKEKRETAIIQGLEGISFILEKEIHHQEVMNDFDCPKVGPQMDLFVV